MAITVSHPEADALTRKFAELAGVGITEALVITMREAMTSAETPRETAAWPRAEHGVA
ncbi:hypothetical protein FF100_19595 [Methylobacterium terricola]|uniref:Uncharacterized protein n=1 Tax=Methylobacterium terricola TaxID=2583531 RepID=A0A5C4LDI7_9HYPH|nr:type II toxin-antitoxin system VapB family antitoxin [Methylobacterium terricola]TNC11334.1 hypothetical protein FF100_19595 [Methylobacterium terricola]